MLPAIKLENVSKTFKVQEKKSSQSLFHKFFRPSYTELIAVDQLSLTIEQGERVAFIGPNGAGKSTAIKMMTGILNPSLGHINVLHYTPWQHRQKLGYEMGVVFGQKSQLWFHLPALDTFNLLAKIYDIPHSEYQSRLKELIDIFQIGDFIQQSVSKMSLGQRMRCELVASLLHKPKILFLDEPSIGLDVTAKSIIRDLIYTRAKNDGTTVFLTSHDTGDMEKICDRVIIINHGKKILDSSLKQLKERYIKKKIVTLVMAKEFINLKLEHTNILSQSPHQIRIELQTQFIGVDKVISEALTQTELKDISVEEAPLEDIIATIYKEGQRNVF